MKRRLISTPRETQCAYSTLHRMTLIQNATITNTGKESEEEGASYVDGGNVAWYSHFERQAKSFFKRKAFHII